MSVMKSITQRIDNVGTTKQIMKAMDMIAASKLQKARARLEFARLLHEESSGIVENLKGSESARSSIYIQPRKVENTAYVVITSDKGLCGSYNYNIAEKALAHMEHGKNEQILVIGTKGKDYFSRRGKNIKSSLTNRSEVQMYDETELVSGLVNSLYVSGEADEVYLAYTKFETTLSYEPRIERLLPIIGGTETVPADISMKYEPGVAAFLDHAIPLYLHSYLYMAIAESVASEHASRMFNMSSASKNATEIIDDLNRIYNRKRQAAITQELNEIVGGVNILK